ncbi:transferase activity protein [[Candida] boidinii]|nr:transferase activity protein [[Candida] boidinii]OWB62380.1 transferase activity protein [[Candida] boidinii]
MGGLNSAISFAKTYKYAILSVVSIFVLLDLIVHGSESVISSSINDIEYDKYLPSSVNSITDNINSNYLKKVPKLNYKDKLSIENRLKYFFTYSPGNEIENNIFQMWELPTSDKKFPKDTKDLMDSWKNSNSGSVYHFLTIQQAEEKITEVLKAGVPEVVEALNLLPANRLKYEFLKYLLIYCFGGCYADIDTKDLTAIRDWYNPRLVPARFYTAVMSDPNDYRWDKLYNRRLTFSNSIFVGKAHHPFLAKLIGTITYVIHAKKHDISKIDWEDVNDSVDSNGEPTVFFTGPSMYTDSLFEYMNSVKNAIHVKVAKSYRNEEPVQLIGPEIPSTQRFSYKQFSGILAPSQVDDIVILPQIAFQGALVKSDDYQEYMKFNYATCNDLTAWSYTPKMGLSGADA